MFNKKLFNKIVAFLLCFVIVFCDIYVPNDAQAYDGVRDDPSSCNMPDDPSQNRAKNPCYTVNFDTTKNYCEIGDIKFSAFIPVNRDLDFELFPVPGNPHCISFIALYTAILFAISRAGVAACAATGLSASLNAGTAIPGLGPGTLVTSILLSNLCIAAGTQCLASNLAACGAIGPCCGTMAGYLIAMATAVAALAIIYGIAREFFKNTRVCGRGWTAWQKEEEIAATEEVQRDKKWLKSKGPYRKCIENIFSPGLHKTTTQLGGSDTAKNEGLVPASCTIDRGADSRINLTPSAKIELFFTGGSSEPTLSDTKGIDNIYYREYIFGGMEYEDNGSGACKNPWTPEERKTILGYSSDNQRYYFSGAGEKSAPNYACNRFLRKAKSDPTSTQGREAYDCCVSRSQNTICIENNEEHKFCENTSKCYLGVVNVEIYNAKANADYICAKSFSLCPYNLPLGGGTEKALYDSNPEFADVKLNFCQHLSHCMKRPLSPVTKSSYLSGAYIAKACYDMKGDSQNSYQYNAGLLPTSTRNFTGPFVQCFKETLENIFTNRAGRDICKDPSYNDMIGCGGTSNVEFSEGQILPDSYSFFNKIQNNFQTIIKLALTFAIMMLGISTLIAVPKQHLEKKTVMQFMMKLAMVVFFALGNGWHVGFSNWVMGISTSMANVTFAPNLFDSSVERIDGCVFPRYNYESANSAVRDFKVRQYPPGKEYLRVWDTLDCKIIRALGYAGNIAVPNLILMMIAGFFTGAFGVIMFVATFIFGFILLSIALRAMHIFLISMSGIIILLFVSPVTITMVMFERTKGIFTNWWKQLAGFSLQPMILFVYISIFLTVFDIILVGSARYVGSVVQVKGTDTFYTGATRIDDQSFVDNYGFIQEKKIDCSGNGGNDSIYCIFYAPKFGSLAGFEAVGFGIPILKELNQQKIETIAKAALLMFIFLNFMDQMTTFASKLVGGATLASNWSIKPSDMARNLNWALRGIQKRGTRGSLKAARGAIKQFGNMRQIANEVKDIRNAMRDGVNGGKGDDDKKDSDNKPDSASSKDDKDPAKAGSKDGADPAKPDSAKDGDSKDKGGAGDNSISAREDGAKGSDGKGGGAGGNAGEDSVAKREDGSGGGASAGGKDGGSAGGAGENSEARREGGPSAGAGGGDAAGGAGGAGGGAGGDGAGGAGGAGGGAGGDGAGGAGGGAGGGDGAGGAGGAGGGDGAGGGAGGGDAAGGAGGGDAAGGAGGGDGGAGGAGGGDGAGAGDGSVARREDDALGAGGGKGGDGGAGAGGGPDGGAGGGAGGGADGSGSGSDLAKGDGADSSKPAGDPDGAIKPVSLQDVEPIVPAVAEDAGKKPAGKTDGEAGDKDKDKDKNPNQSKSKDDQDSDATTQEGDSQGEDSSDKDGEDGEGGDESADGEDGDDKGDEAKASSSEDKGGKQNGKISPSKGSKGSRGRSSSPSRGSGGGGKARGGSSGGGSAGSSSDSQGISKGIMSESSGLDSTLKSEGLLSDLTKGGLGGPLNKGIGSKILDGKSSGKSEPLPLLGALGNALGGVIEPGLKSVDRGVNSLFGIKDDRSPQAGQIQKTNARSTSAYSAGSAMNAMSKGSASQSKSSVKESVSASLVLKDSGKAQKSDMLLALKQSSAPDAKGGGKSQSGGGSALDLSSVILSPKTGDMKSGSKVYSSGPAKEAMSSSPAKSSGSTSASGSTSSVASTFASKAPSTPQPSSSSSPSTIGQTGSKSPAVGVQKTSAGAGNTSAKSSGGSSSADQPDLKMASKGPAQTSAVQQSRPQGTVSNVSPQNVKLDFPQEKSSSASGGSGSTGGGGSSVNPSANSAFEALSKSSQAGSSSASKAPADLVKESLARVRSQQSSSAGGGQVEQSQKASTASSSSQANAKSPTPFNDALGKYVGDPLSKGIDPVTSAISSGVDNLFGSGQQKSSSPVSSQVSKAISSKKSSPPKTSKPSGGVEIEEVEVEFEEDDQPIQSNKSYSPPQPTQNSKTVVAQPPAPKQQAKQQTFDPWAGFNQFFDDLTGKKK